MAIHYGQAIDPITQPQGVAPSAVPAPQPSPVSSGPNLWSQLGAGGYSALNEVGMGLPDLIVKNTVGSPNYQALQKFREQNKLGSDIGGLAGDIGSMFIPGMGAGKAATLLGKGAVMAAKQAIPRAVTGSISDIEDNPQNAGQIIQNKAGEAALGIGAGALMNPAITKAGQALGEIGGKVANKFGRQMADQYLSGVGVTGSDIADHIASGAPSKTGVSGTVAANLEPEKIKLAQYGQARGINSDDSLKQYLLKSEQELKPVAASWDANRPGASSFWQKVQRHPDVANGTVNAQSDIAPIFQAITDPQFKMGGYWDTMSTLDRAYSDASKVLNAAPQGGNEAIRQARAYKDVIGSIRDDVKNHAFDNISDESLSAGAKDLRDNWRYHQIFQDASINNSKNMQGTAQNMGGGALNSFSNPAIGRAVATGALGYGLTPGDDQNQKLLGGLGGAAAGAFAPNFISKEMNSLMTRASGKLLPQGEPARWTGNTAPIQKAHGILGQLSGQLPAAAGLASSKIPGQPQATPPSTAMTAQVQNLPTGVHATQAPVQMGSETINVGGPTQIDMNSPAGQRILATLDSTYNFYHPTQNGKPISRQEYFDLAKDQTNNFSPMASVNLLGNTPEERQQLAASLPRLDTLKSIDFNKLTNPANTMNPLIGITDMGAKNSMDRMQELVADAYKTDPSKPVTNQEKAYAQNLINNIVRDMSMNPEQKKKALIDLLAQKGFRADLLSGLGLAQGSPIEGYR